MHNNMDKKWTNLAAAVSQLILEAYFLEIFLNSRMNGKLGYIIMWALKH